MNNKIVSEHFFFTKHGLTKTWLLALPSFLSKQKTLFNIIYLEG